MFIELIKATLLPQLKETARASWRTLGVAASTAAAGTSTPIDDVLAEKVFGDDKLFDAFYTELETRLLERFFGNNPAVLQEVRQQLTMPPQ